MPGTIKITEYTDAMCSWAWGTEPKLRLLRWRFEHQLSIWRLVMGHLVEDEFMPDRDREAEATKLQGYWKVVCDQTGMPRPDPLRRSPAGSRASGLVVKAARAISDEAAQSAMRRLREATFVHGEPPDTMERALHAVREANHIDLDILVANLAAAETAEAYERDLDETRHPNEHVLNLEGDRPGIGRAREARDGRMRFVFPTLVMRSSTGEATVPGWMDYQAYEDALFSVGAEADERTRSRPTPEEALGRWPTLAETELAFICGPDAEPPADTVVHRWAGGTLICAPAEAAANGLGTGTATGSR